MTAPEHPLLLKGRLVVASLDGLKSQTRRLDRRFALRGVVGVVGQIEDGPAAEGHSGDWLFDNGTPAGVVLRCPYGAVGDLLWVRETWRRGPTGYVYRATHTDGPGLARPVWKPGIHMPREAARLILEVTRVRCERLQSISEEDAIAEGVRPIKPDEYGGIVRQSSTGKAYEGAAGMVTVTARLAFESLWDSINLTRGPWAANPLVWAIDYKVVP